MTHHELGPGARRTSRTLAAAGGLLAFSLLLAACGSNAASGHHHRHHTSGTSGTSGTAGTSGTSGTSGSTGTTGASGSSGTTTTTASTVPTTTSSTLVPVNGNVVQCATSALSMSLGSSSGSAGAVDVALVLENTGKLPCYLYGYPAVTAVTGAHGSQIGLAAQHATQLGPKTVVTIRPGAEANADLHVAEALNYPPARCKPTTPAGFRVVPPGASAAGFVPSQHLKVCSADVSGQLAVGPVSPGAHSGVNGATASSSSSSS